VTPVAFLPPLRLSDITGMFANQSPILWYRIALS
jgi:hypothetical protein